MSDPESQRIQVGEKKITTLNTTTMITTPITRKKSQHEGPMISLDLSQKTLIERRVATPPNKILTGFIVTIVPCTPPHSYAALPPPSIWGQNSWMGTKNCDRHATEHSDLPCDWWWHPPTHLGPRSTIVHCYPWGGSLGGNGGSGGNTTQIWFFARLRRASAKQRR